MKKLIKIFTSTFLISLIIFSGILYYGYIQKDDSTLVENDHETSINEVSNEVPNEIDINTTKENAANTTNTTITEPTTKAEIIEFSDIILTFTGDIYFPESIQRLLKENGINSVISTSIQKEFDESDITMINQEFPFSTNGTPANDKQFTFRIDPNYAVYLKDMGVDIVTLANNHTLDYGIEALQDTFSTLDEVGIPYVGAGNNLNEAKQSYTFTIQDRKIAILAASRVIPVPDWNATDTKPGLLTTYDPQNLIKEIEKAKKDHDYIVVYVHWGVERDEFPDKYQRTLAYQYIDAGADFVIGSHPHVLQGIEYYKEKLIVYSLGNFIFNNLITKTAILKIEIKEDGQYETRILPCFSKDGFTQIESDQDKIKSFYEYMTNISYDISIDKNGYIQFITKE